MAGFVFTSSKSSCLGLFAGGSITCVSHFTKCSWSWDRVANLEHLQAVFFILAILKGSQVVYFVLPAAVFDLWAILFVQQIFPVLISPASQRHEAHFAVTEPSWCLPEKGKIQHEMHPFATMPCSYRDLSVFCSVLYLAHPSYITAPSTCCSLKCRCQRLSGRASLSAQ